MRYPLMYPPLLLGGQQKEPGEGESVRWSAVEPEAQGEAGCSNKRFRDQCGGGERDDCAEAASVGHRIHSIVVLPSGQHIVIGLWDRLLLVGVSHDTGSPRLFVRACLDIVEGFRAEYSVQFSGNSNSLRIWRMMNAAPESVPGQESAQVL